MLMLEHLHGHVEEVVEFSVDVRHGVAHQVRHVAHSAIKLLADALARFLERLQNEKFAKLLTNLKFLKIISDFFHNL
jgi:hypothetical protein